MSYSTQAQLVERYSEKMLIDISDRGETPTGEIDAALIARAIADADALIDGYLKVRYALPLADVPDLVRDLSLAISIYKAHAHVAAEKITADYKDALKTLEQIARGLIQLDVEGVEPAPSGAAEVRTNQPERPLSAATMKGYI
ncbi:gp436 family protein [Mesorhizobium australicum]|uniref:Mu-like prophage protein gp36 n=1 Tax=Mesorhizobium australicum TaxID=536018 RepID=A0A1X7NXE7_9HYPH|nr:DUF1320 domain-containing protein [Mesorhizobium australicum]SMH42479.1 Mu-like prophage protein gp36 [Mesorhizobium australicum]